MIKGITYYKLVSDYEGAIPPKDCGLKGEEIDNNFYVLEGRDVNGVTVEDDKIVITLVNGDTISSDDVFSNFAKDLSFDFDNETGTLYITQNGQTTEITGFGCGEDCCFHGVYTDETLLGDGTIDNPLSISPAYRSYSFAPAVGIIDKTIGETYPDTENLAIGTTYVVKDYVNEYGMLYCYDGVRQICCELHRGGSEWRIPTKNDWDDMLNAIEPIEADRNHQDRRSNQWLGKYAGKLLKSSEYWRYEPQEEESNEGENNCGHCCDDNDPCRPKHCGEFGHCCDKPKPIDPKGTDQYGFTVIPTGYGVNVAGEIGCAGFGDVATFWTSEATNDKAVAYIKGFQWNETRVQQDVVPASTQYHALRLVKDYTGSNFYGREEILGVEYDTVLMPSLSDGKKVWTAVNFSKTGDELCSLEPGCGREDINKKVVYYISVWDGERWVSTALKEGYTVTIIIDGKPVDYHILINQETGDSELSEKNKSEEIEAEIDELENEVEALTERVNQIEEKIGDYNPEKGTIEERLAQLENKINTMNHDFADVDDNPGYDDDDRIIVDGEAW